RTPNGSRAVASSEARSSPPRTSGTPPTGMISPRVMFSSPGHRSPIAVSGSHRGSSIIRWWPRTAGGDGYGARVLPLDGAKLPGCILGAQQDFGGHRRSGRSGAMDKDHIDDDGRAELSLLDFAGYDTDETEQSWQERALCAQTDPEAFFPEKGGSTREAKKVCVSCEVRAE